MTGNDFDSSWRQKPILKKFNTQNTIKEKKQIRKTLIFIFALTILSTGFAILYREIPILKKKIFEPKIVVSEKYPLKEPSPTPTPKLLNEKKQIEEMILPLRGIYGIYYQDLETKDSFSINGKEKMQAASLNKLPVMLLLYREAEAGRMNLDEKYLLQASDKRNGAGSLMGRPVGYEITYREMAQLMGSQSDNTAFNILSRILGADKIQSLESQLGMVNSLFDDWQTTPEDIGLLFRKLYLEKVVSDKDRDEILSFLTNTIWEDRIPAGIPSGVRVAHKIGTEVGVISDAGIVFGEHPFILVIMSDKANEIEAKKALPEITKKIWEMVEK